MPSGNRAPRVPSDLRIVMSVQVDESRRDHQASRIDNFLRDVDENIFAGVDTGMSKILDERLGLFGRHGAGGGSEAATLGPE